MPPAKANRSKGEVPGSFYQRGGRWWWRVKLPTDRKAVARPLIPPGGQCATTDLDTAIQLARELWDRAAADTAAGDTDRTVAGLVWAFMKFARQYYRDPQTGEPTKEAVEMQLALNPLLRPFPDPDRPDVKLNYAIMPAADFNVACLDKLRDHLIQLKDRKGRQRLCRYVINHRINRIRRAFRWAHRKMLVPASTFYSLTALDGLKVNRSAARETEEVHPVEEAVIRRTMEWMPPTLRAMVELQLLTGMRPGELVIMRVMDLTPGPEVWTYRPGSHLKHGQHKNAWRGHDREIPLGPKCQQILLPLLSGLRTDQYVFSPKQVQVERLAAKHEARTTPLSCGNRPGSNKKAKPRKGPTDRYAPDTYYQAVTYAIQAGNRAILRAIEERLGKDADPKAVQAAYEAEKIPHWHPHQVRHTAATVIRREISLDAARAMLGHKSLGMADHYAEIDKTIRNQAAMKLA